MNITYIPAVLRRLVEQRASYRCEYCLLPAGVSFLGIEVSFLGIEVYSYADSVVNL